MLRGVVGVGRVVVHLLVRARSAGYFSCCRWTGDMQLELSATVEDIMRLELSAIARHYAVGVVCNCQKRNCILSECTGGVCEHVQNATPTDKTMLYIV